MREQRQPTLEVKYVRYLGEVGCGKAVPAYDNVYPFLPQDELIPVALPVNMRDKDAGILTVRGLSLNDFGIFDGDQLLVKHRPSWTEITEDTVCIVLIHSTGEVVAKRIERGANTLILKASGGGIADMEYGIDEIEIRSIVVKALFDIDTLISRSREAKVRLNGIGRRKRIDEHTPQLFSERPTIDDIPY